MREEVRIVGRTSKFSQGWRWPWINRDVESEIKMDCKQAEGVDGELLSSGG